MEYTAGNYLNCNELHQQYQLSSANLPKKAATRGHASSHFKHMQACGLTRNHSDG